MADEQATSNDNSEEANRIIKRYGIGAAAVGVVPVPLVDLALLLGVQLKMLHALCKVYETQFSAELGRSLVAALIGGGGTTALGSGTKYLVGSMLKSVPLAGTAAGIAGTAGFGYATTYAVGKVFVQHFETGGTLLTFDADKLKDYYAEQFGEAKKSSENSPGYVGVKP